MPRTSDTWRSDELASCGKHHRCVLSVPPTPDLRFSLLEHRSIFFSVHQHTAVSVTRGSQGTLTSRETSSIYRSDRNHPLPCPPKLCNLHFIAHASVSEAAHRGWSVQIYPRVHRLDSRKRRKIVQSSVFRNRQLMQTECNSLRLNQLHLIVQLLLCSVLLGLFHIVSIYMSLVGPMP